MKKIIKKFVHYISFVMTLPLVLFAKYFGHSAFIASGQFLALFPGKTGSYLRVAYYSMTLIQCSKQVYIGFGSYFSQPDVVVEEGVYIGAYCIIGKSRIGKHTTIASNVHILSGRHQHGYENVGISVQNQEGNFQIVSISENCWIGSCALIMADLGRQSIVGAGAVVVNQMGERTVIVGNPGKVVKNF